MTGNPPPPVRTILVAGDRSVRDEPALHERASDDLRYIRSAMERAGSFTSVSGAGMVAVGVVGLGATYFSRGFSFKFDVVSLLAIWLAAALTAVVVSWAAIRAKSVRTRQSLSSGPARTFLIAFIPSLLAGGVLTAAFYYRQQPLLLPGTWLTLYGAAVAAGGATSVRPVPIMGVAFMVLGGAAFAVPPGYLLPLLALGFGGLHLMFGALIWRNYGG